MTMPYSYLFYTWSVPSEKAVQHDEHASWILMVAYPCLLHPTTGSSLSEKCRTCSMRPLTAVTDLMDSWMWGSRRRGWKMNYTLQNFIGCHTLTTDLLFYLVLSRAGWIETVIIYYPVFMSVLCTCLYNFFLKVVSVHRLGKKKSIII